VADKLLPEFQNFLISRSLAPEKNTPFYAHWVSKFLAFSKGLSELPGAYKKSFIINPKPGLQCPAVSFQGRDQD